jgi:four helix bundle protein
VRHIAEGANRIHPKDKAARFVLARAELGEADAALEMVAALGLAPEARVRGYRMLADRVGAMLWGLIRRERQRSR